MERFTRALYEEFLWLQEGICSLELITAFGDWITPYNEHYLRSALDYKTPKQFEWNHHGTPSPPLLVA